jgi:predicted transcriptional regulator
VDLAVNCVVKRQARAIIDTLPDTATWFELVYALELCAEIEAGIADADAGRVTDVDELRREYGLTR